MSSPKVAALAFAANGKTLVTGDDATSSVQGWDVATGEEVFQVQVPAISRTVQSVIDTNGVLAVRSIMMAPTAGTRSLAFSPDGGLLLLGMADGTMRVWDMQVREERGRTNSEQSAQGVAVTADGKTLTAIDGSGNVLLWELPAATRKKH